MNQTGSLVDFKVQRHPPFSVIWASVLLLSMLNSGVAEPRENEGTPRAPLSWKVLWSRDVKLRDSPMRSVQDFKFQGPHAGHPFLLGDFEADGEWKSIEGELQRTRGANSLLELPEVNFFDVEGVFSSDRLGGMLFLVGWTPKNSGYVVYNVTMKDKASGSPWHLCRIENGHFVEGEDREIARHEWEGTQSMRLSVREKKLTLAIGKTRVLQDLPLATYQRGSVYLGTYNTRYGPKPLRIRSVRIREIAPLDATSQLATEGSR